MSIASVHSDGRSCCSTWNYGAFKLSEMWIQVRSTTKIIHPLYPFLKCKYQSQGAMIKIVIVWLWHLLICHRAERKNQRDKEKVSLTRFYFNWPILSISCTPRLLTKIFFSHDDNFSDGIRCWCQKLLLLFAHQRFNDKGKIKILLTLIRLNSHCPRALFFHTFIRNIK